MNPLVLITPSLLIASGIMMLRHGVRRGDRLLWLGLAATMVGDYFLVLCNSRIGTWGFIGGVAGFSLAQLLWIFGFCREAKPNFKVFTALAVPLACFAISRLWPEMVKSNLSLLYPTFSAVTIYSLLSAFSLAAAFGTRRWLPVIAVALLMFSDLMISFRDILHIKAVAPLIGISYLAALLFMALAIAFSGRLYFSYGRGDPKWTVIAGGTLSLSMFAAAVVRCPVAHNPFVKMLSYFGRTKIAGETYPASHFLFMAGLAAGALSAAYFYPYFAWFVESQKRKLAVYWGGAVNVAGLLTILLVPENVCNPAHNLGCWLAVLGGATVVLALCEKLPEICWAVYLSIVAFALFVAVVIHELGFIAFSPTVPILQKVVIISFVVWILAYAFRKNPQG